MAVLQACFDGFCGILKEHHRDTESTENSEIFIGFLACGEQTNKVFVCVFVVFFTVFYLPGSKDKLRYITA